MPNQLKRSHISTCSIHGRPPGWPMKERSSAEGPWRRVSGAKRMRGAVVPSGPRAVAPVPPGPWREGGSVLRGGRDSVMGRGSFQTHRGLRRSQCIRGRRAELLCSGAYRVPVLVGDAHLKGPEITMVSRIPDSSY